LLTGSPVAKNSVKAVESTEDIARVLTQKR